LAGGVAARVDGGRGAEASLRPAVRWLGASQGSVRAIHTWPEAETEAETETEIGTGTGMKGFPFGAALVWAENLGQNRKPSGRDGELG